MNPADVVAIIAALVVDRSVVAPEADRVRAEKAAIRRARRLYARCHDLNVADVPGGEPSRGVAAEDDVSMDDRRRAAAEDEA
jgi:hypothetical protein